MLSEAPASTPNRLSRSGSSAARCLTVDSRRESANLLRRLSCCVRQSLRLPMREMQRSFHSPLRQPCRIAREPATTLQSALTLQSSGTRLSLRSFLTPHFHVGRHGRQQRMDRGDGNRLVSFRCRQQAHRGFHLLQFVFGVGADQSGQRGAQQGNVGLSFPHRVVRTCLYVVGQHLASVRRCVLRVFVPAINACEYSSVHVFLRSCLPPNIPVNGTGGKRRFTNQAASRAGPLPCTLYGFSQCIVNSRPKHHHRIWEWCAVFRSAKLQPPSHKKHLTLRAVVVPPPRIYSRREQANYRRPVLFCAAVGFRNPSRNLSAIGRVHPAHTAPVLLKPVAVRGVVVAALCVFWQGAPIHLKPKHPVQPVKKLLWGSPQVRLAAEHQIVIHRLSQKPYMYQADERAGVARLRWRVSGR